MQTDFKDVRCVDAAKLGYYPAHHRPVSLTKVEANAKGAQADKEGNKDTSGFQFKIFALCYITTFDEVRCSLVLPWLPRGGLVQGIPAVESVHITKPASLLQ